MIRCTKCHMFKIDNKSKCACNVKKFDDKKLSGSKKPIKQISDKKRAEIKKRWSLLDFYSRIAKKHFDDAGDWICEYCGSKFNILDFIDNRVCFAHILPKGDPLYRHLATFENNIAIVCGDTCHKDMDSEICRLWIRPELQKQIEDGKKICVSELENYIDR